MSIDADIDLINSCEDNAMSKQAKHVTKQEEQHSATGGVALANNGSNGDNSNDATCCACGDKGHASRDCTKNIEFNEQWIHKNKNKVKASAFAQIVEEHDNLNAGNDLPACLFPVGSSGTFTQ